MKKYELIENKQIVGTTWAKSLHQAKYDFTIWFDGQYIIRCGKKRVKVYLA